ncbi:MAG: Fic family protein [Candidatus Melainabacteria bacterium]|nr:Fic family protein [Candidatus Melainabacteria bacterium]OPZ89010.1 MAG: Fic/DOC family protein [bacterium ADurb.Bin425]
MDLPIQKPALFQGVTLPSGTTLAGLSALVHAFNVQAPVRQSSCITEQNIKGHIKEERGWKIYSKRYELEPTVQAHLNFAMRYENIDLLVLKRVFISLPAEAIEQYVLSAPNSVLTRRAWYLYELLTGNMLAVPDAPNVTSVDLLDTDKYFTKASGTLSRRHKVRDNLLGTARFCPIIRKTELLKTLVESNLSKSALSIIGRVSKSVVSRAASFLLLADSQASFQIEGERPARNRIERWGRAIMQAGKNPLSVEEIIRLHGILIEDNRFVQGGLRTDGVFLGEHTADGEPLPEFIGAKPDALADLMNSLIEANTIMKEGGLDPVLQAAATAFGFVYVHPFADGNGRLHRCLIHHTLSDRQFTPPGMLFPVSSVMLDWIDKYRETLQSHSARLMEFIEWEPAAKGNIHVLNDTADLYRYFDCTESAEFLYSCVRRTVEADLPREIDYLTRRDQAVREVMNVVEMPDLIAEQFVLFVHRNGGTLPKNRREREFVALKEEELIALEEIVRDAFDGFDNVPG